MAGMTHGAWCHIEVPTKSPEASQKFYGGVCGWTFTHIPEMNYTMYSAGKDEIAGGIFDPPPGVPRQIMTYVNVRDLDVASKKVLEFGGRLCGPAVDVPGHGKFRPILDPDGNALALWQGAAKKKAKAAPKKKRR